MTRPSNASMCDKELVRRAKQADPQAIALIYERYSPPIFRYIYFRVRDHDLASDIQAEVFLRMLESIGHYEERGWPLSAWLYSIARARTADSIRQRIRQRQVPLEAVCIACEGPEDEVGVRIDYEEVRHTIGELTDGQQQVIMLRYIANKSIAQVAHELGRSQGSVKALQHRAIQNMGRLMAQHDLIA